MSMLTSDALERILAKPEQKKQEVEGGELKAYQKVNPFKRMREARKMTLPEWERHTGISGWAHFEQNRRRVSADKRLEIEKKLAAVFYCEKKIRELFL